MAHAVLGFPTPWPFLPWIKPKRLTFPQYHVGRRGHIRSLFLNARPSLVILHVSLLFAPIFVVAICFLVFFIIIVIVVVVVFT